MVKTEKSFQCETCNKWYVSPASLQVHQHLHKQNQERNFACNFCDKSFFTNGQRRQHEKTHNTGEFPCQKCNKTFNSHTYLKNHFNLVHSGIKPFPCQVCEKAFARKSELKNHVRTHTGERPFECPECKSTFKQLSNLQTHIRTTHKGEERCKCDECGKGFKRQRLLTYHIFAKHKNDKPLQCLHCAKKFIYPQQLKKHMMKCQSKPIDFFELTTANNEKYFVQRIGSNFSFINSNEFPGLEDLNLEEQHFGAMQPNNPELGNKAMTDHSQQSVVPVEPNRNIQQVIDISDPIGSAAFYQENNFDSALFQPNNHIIQGIITTEPQQSRQVIQFLYKHENGNWHTCKYIQDPS